MSGNHGDPEHPPAANLSEAIKDAAVDPVGDSEEGSWVDLKNLNWSALASPVVVRALALVAVAIAVLLWPERSNRILARLVGAGLLVLSVTAFWAALKASPRQWLRVATSSVLLLMGAFLLLSPDRSDTFLGRLLALSIVIGAGRDLVTEFRRRSGERGWVLTRSSTLLVGAGVLAVFPTEIFSAIITVTALAVIALCFLVVVIALDPVQDDPSTYEDSQSLIRAWLDDRPKSLEDRAALYDKVLFDGPEAAKRVTRFFTLMTFASVIASMGVITDSTAVVIGAMLIAPLMTPLMGMAMSLVMGWPKRLTHSSAIAFGGIALAITVGIVLGLTVPTIIDTTANSQILARSSPTTLDLITAIAAGAAGAYGLSRPDVSDSLPGVAIAISLVPPLTVVGIAWSQGDWASGNGALLLFSTNMIAILVVGGLTFLATGVTPLRRIMENQRRVRTSVASVLAAGAIIVGLLLLNGSELTANLFDQSAVEESVQDWIDAAEEHNVAAIRVDSERVEVAIIGPSDGAPSASDLAARLEAALGRPVTAVVRLLVEERDVAESSGS